MISAFLCTEKLTVSQTNDRRRWWTGFSCPAKDCKAVGLRMRVDFAEGHKIIGTQALRAIHKVCATPHENSGKKKVHRLVLSTPQVLMSAVHTLQNLRIGLRKRHPDKSHAPAVSFGCLVPPSAVVLNKARGKTVCRGFRSIQCTW